MTRAAWAAALALAALAGGSLAAAQDAPVFRSSVEAVYVDVFVTDGGRPVPGLRASDFELKDDGVSQQVRLAAAESLPLTTILVFDTSSSLTGEKLQALRAAGEAFLDGLRPADQAALVTFSEEIAWLAEPTPDKATVRHALGRLHAEGATAVFDALYASLILADQGPRSLIVLFTDGQDNMSVLDDVQLRTSAERSSSVIHVVGWNAPASTTLFGSEQVQARPLRDIAEATGGRFWTAQSPTRLREAFAAIANAMAERYVLQYEPEGVARSGWHPLEVRLRASKGKVQARRGYWVAALR